jgi:predicted XRE-type DNA-binding protein
MGFSPDKARNLALRSNLMSEVEQIIEEQGLTQTQAAKVFGVSQPRMSDLLRGKIERFSVDTLIRMLERGGARVEITVRAA